MPVVDGGPVVEVVVRGIVIEVVVPEIVFGGVLVAGVVIGVVVRTVPGQLAPSVIRPVVVALLGARTGGGIVLAVGVPATRSCAHSIASCRSVPSLVADACNTGRVRITLLSRAGCAACARARADLRPVVDEFEVEFDEVDVDAVAATDPSLRAEFGDRLPVILLDDREHSYWDVDIPRLRADLRGAAGH